MLSMGRLAQASGVNVETVRYYERIGLMPEPSRTAGGHRTYDEGHRRRLSFIRRARELGFTLEQVRELLRLADQEAQPCGAVVRIAGAHLDEVRRKIADLTRLEAILAGAVARCETTASGPDCAVLEMLSDGG
ncbi:helix-turn-helix domain-containing protein [Phenylobacterium sp.]|uniref:MerR family transcriptional regulator n=1 Tax=Phenylobacterium sp. TaxID=1871053 RepID=UPI002810F09E|nr:helix-turn-helix domain-containing protein [Phenylobacterium sp.]